jgi:hypothetical protein
MLQQHQQQVQQDVVDQAGENSQMEGEPASCIDEGSEVVSQCQQGAPHDEVDENESTQKAALIGRQPNF